MCLQSEIDNITFDTELISLLENIGINLITLYYIS